MVYSAILDDTSTVSQFTRRKKITITTDGTSTPVNYQVKLTITYEPGMEVSFADVRFNTKTGTYIDMWQESHTDSTTADIWIELPDTITDPGSDYIWMYYGNDSLSDGGNLDDTFLFGDDFPGSTLDGAKWNEWVSAGSYSVSSGILQVTGAAAGWEIIGAKTQFSPNVILEFYGKFDEQDITGISIDDRSATGSHAGTGVDGAQYSYDSGDGGKLYRTIRETTDTNNSRTSTLSSYTNLKMVWLSGSVAFYENNVLKDTISTNVPADDCGAQVQAYGSTSDVFLDWVMVRVYIANEPTLSYGIAQHQRKTPIFIG